MVSNRNFTALDWISTELEEVVQQASNALAKWLVATDDEAQLRFCLAYLHQSVGSLRMVQCYGVALLAEELELLCQAVIDGKVSEVVRATRVLKQGLNELPALVQHALNSKTDDPLPLFSLLNDIRAVRAHNLFSETPVFLPNLEPLNVARKGHKSPSIDAVKLRTALQKLRQMYQFSVMSLHRSVETEKAAKYLVESTDRLMRLSSGTAAEPMWTVANGLARGVQTQKIEASDSLLLILRQLDHYLKLMIEHGAKVLSERVPTGLAKNLLFQALPLQELDTNFRNFLAPYGLNTALPHSQGDRSDTAWPILSAVDRRRIFDALATELNHLHDLALQASETALAKRDYRALVSGLRRNTDALALLGEADLATKLEVLLRQLVSEGLLTKALPQVAAELELVLSASKKLGQGVQTTEWLTRESREYQAVDIILTYLEATKDELNKYVVDQFDSAHLDEAVQNLTKVRDALTHTDEPAMSHMVGACARYMATKMNRDSVDWDAIDRLANILPAIEYVIESVSITTAERDRLLERASTDLEALGYRLSALEAPAVSEEVFDDEPMQVDLTASDHDANSDEQTSTEAPKHEIDEEILEIFIEEVDEVFENIDRNFEAWRNDYTNRGALTEFRRAFHTLKGSGRMVGAEIVGELAWSVEDYLNRVLDGNANADLRTEQLVAEVREWMPFLVEAFRTLSPDPNSNKTTKLSELAGLLKSGADKSFDKALADLKLQDQEIEQAQEQALEVDQELIEIFVNEAEAHLETLAAVISEARENEPMTFVPEESTRRALHTLKGSAYMSELPVLAEIAAPVERLTKALIANNVSVDSAYTDLLSGVVSTLKALIPKVVEGEDVSALVDHEALFATIDSLHDRWIEPIVGGEKSQFDSGNPAFIELMSSPEIDALFNIEEVLSAWVEIKNREALKPLRHSLTALYELSVTTDEAELTALVAAIIELLSLETLLPSDDAVNVIRDTTDGLVDRINQLVASQKMSPVAELKRQVLSLMPDTLPDNVVSIESSKPVVQEPSESLSEENTTVVENADATADADESIGAGEPVEASKLEQHNLIERFAHAASDIENDVDEDILLLFVEEADELLVVLDAAMEAWRLDTTATSPNEDLQRYLHTYKGSARMAGLNIAGAWAHELESWLILNFKKEVVDSGIATALHSVDLLRIAVERSRSWLAQKDFDLVAKLQGELLPVDTDNTESVEATSDAEEVESSRATTLEGNEAVTQLVAAQEQAESAKAKFIESPVPNFEHKAPQEVVRVNAVLLDELVNLAGETSISRARVEQQVVDFTFTINEMESTLGRLRDQIRRLDLETEAQISHRQEQFNLSKTQEGFDPLEMDRYTTLQQLSRSLAESTSDLLDLKSTLSDKTKDTETLLLQQGRINTDLQEGLMRSRMVMFSRLVPRLRRVVRQVSQELGKKVSLELGNVEGELDRNMLDKMVAPLEHMLRNAIDHGLESGEERIAKGKPEEGTIRLFVAREGAQVVIGLSDDGAGIDVNRVRQKAIDSGLLAPTTELTDQEIYQFIFRAGFTTRDDVSQISGRGVGLDVVAQEVRQLGGQLEVTSEPGLGSQFVVRLPFTLSVNRALMIGVADDSYALPLSSVEGIARIDVKQLEELYSNPDKTLDIGSQNYELRYLGEVMGVSAKPKLLDDGTPVPLVLVRSDEHHYAMQVDRLFGSREIVVKALGPQFASTPGLSGATILGDGSVVVILDLVAMLRESRALGFERQALEVISESSSEREKPLVMVVDDSVTVRKVTSRLLTREGYDVVTAKDGIDAVRQLQDTVPDVMLLDIEMPNMDGFEVAQHVKNSTRLKAVPIIMITSRTGQKHRERAMDIGVEQYLGKPYQEDVLLEEIRTLAEERSRLKTV